MKQPNSDRDFIGGILLVPLLHLAFTIVWIGIFILLTLIFSALNRVDNLLLSFIPIATLGITQISYLIPAYAYFARQQRPEVGKGIIFSATITALLNGACAVPMIGIVNLGALPLIGIVIAVTVTIGLIGRLIIQRRR